MALLALGINHKTASVDIRERVTFSGDRIHEALRDLCDIANVEEAAILSTCNRTELYCSTELQGSRALLEWLGDYHGLKVSELEACSYAFWGEDAARHMMRVASGLDSLILGEPQILGQMKSAYVTAKEANTIGGMLGRLFQQTFSVAKRVRTDTAIGENPVSVAYASVNLASRIFSDMSENTALLIGAGETIELVSKHLKEAGVRKIIVANRTLSRARELADQLDGSAITLADIPSRLAEADIVIASTASPLPILGKGAVERALKLRKHKPIFMVDIAVPRDIEPQVGELDDVYLYTVDDLKQVVEENIKSRQGAAEEASHLVDSGAADFMYQLRARGAVNTLKQFRGYADEIRSSELEKALSALRGGTNPEKVLALLAKGITNKLIHTPTVQARKASADGRPEVNEWIRELYDLPDTANTEFINPSPGAKNEDVET
ncbi:MAG: glutamyl-tRNA reductase [Hahellaceae bacterium]|nr:glutamyl-tRNA reductase [Hahellaceae bacterium]MCP5212438.1 glutamyl-tRNA reductase [Hahellaceae bacterium]